MNVDNEWIGKIRELRWIRNGYECQPPLLVRIIDAEEDKSDYANNGDWMPITLYYWARNS